MAGDEVLKYSGFKTINGGFTIGKEEKGNKVVMEMLFVGLF